MALISVIVPSCNRHSLLQEALASVLAQSHLGRELLIVDDGSSDGTPALVRSQQQSAPHIRLIERTSHGLDTNGAQLGRSLGLQMSQGGVLLFLDFVDLLDTYCLIRRLALLEMDHEIDAVVG